MSTLKTKPTAKLIWDRRYWQDRADEAKAAAEDVRNPECKRIMLEIAATYQHLANLTSDFTTAASKGAVGQLRTAPAALTAASKTSH
jgi:hypothetical protein